MKVLVWIPNIYVENRCDGMHQEAQHKDAGIEGGTLVLKSSKFGEKMPLKQQDKSNRGGHTQRHMCMYPLHTCKHALHKHT